MKGLREMEKVEPVDSQTWWIWGMIGDKLLEEWER